MSSFLCQCLAVSFLHIHFLIVTYVFASIEYGSPTLLPLVLDALFALPVRSFDERDFVLEF